MIRFFYKDGKTQVDLTCMLRMNLEFLCFVYVLTFIVGLTIGDIIFCT